MKLWLALSFAVVFAAGAAVGMIATTSSRPDPHGRGSFFFGPPDPMASLITSESVYRELGIDEKQEALINQTLAAHEESVRQIKSKMQSLSSELRTSIAAVLTPDQQARFKKIQDDRALKEMEVRVAQELVTLKKELSLTDQQEKGVHEILRGDAQAKQELFQQPGKHDPRLDWPKLSAQRDAKLQGLLSPEQFEKYRAYKERRRSGGDRKGRQGFRGDEASFPAPPGPRPGELKPGP